MPEDEAREKYIQVRVCLPNDVLSLGHAIRSGRSIRSVRTFRSVIEAALSRAQELDREAQAQAVAEDEGDDEEEAEAEAEEHGVAEERAHEEDAYVQSMVLSFFYYSFGMMCFLRAYRPRHPLHPFRPLRPLRPLLPLRPLP